MQAIDDIRNQAEIRIETPLPLILDAATFTTTTIPEPPLVIHGILHRGSKLVYGGNSKAFKSWVLEDMSVAVSTGGDWLGHPTTQGNVLYVNFELQEFALQRRLRAIADARGCAVPPSLKVWNLRGFCRPLPELLPELIRQIKGDSYSLITLDPTYKLLGGRNENDAGDIGELCAEIEAVSTTTGAAVAFGAHYAKGNASGKEHLDRVAGSGVWSRDADTIITATSHEQDKAYVVEMTCRNFPPPLPFVMRWEYPRMIVDLALDPERLKKPRKGRTAEHSVKDILRHLTTPMNSASWQKECQAAGISYATFYRLLSRAESDGLTVKDGKVWKTAEKK